MLKLKHWFLFQAENTYETRCTNGAHFRGLTASRVLVCRSRFVGVWYQVSSSITPAKSAGSRAHVSGSKPSVQLPEPRPMSRSVQFQECAGNASLHVTNVIFTAGREVNSRNSKSTISVMIAKALFQLFWHKLCILLCTFRIKSSFSRALRDFWVWLWQCWVCSPGGRGGGFAAGAQPCDSGQYSNPVLLGLCCAEVGRPGEGLFSETMKTKLNKTHTKSWEERRVGVKLALCLMKIAKLWLINK